MFMMVECVKEELQGMKEGMTDVIPHDLLSGLTAEVCVCLSVCLCIYKAVYVCLCVCLYTSAEVPSLSRISSC